MNILVLNGSLRLPYPLPVILSKRSASKDPFSFVVLRATRPRGPSLCLRHRQGFALQGEIRILRLALLAQDDMRKDEGRMPPKGIFVAADSGG